MSIRLVATCWALTLAVGFHSPGNASETQRPASCDQTIISNGSSEIPIICPSDWPVLVRPAS